jgi:GNAT superfamily N-acetyltransferase
MNIEVRCAEPSDARAIAELHAASWRNTYRGVFSETYLDGDVQEERQRHWLQCLMLDPRQDQGVLVAMVEGELAGFICIYLDAEPGWGPLLDNLHVRSDCRGRGIGQCLIQAGIAWMRARGSFDRWYLWVVEANAPARRIYEHLGWAPGERTIHVAADGTEFAVLRYTQRLAEFCCKVEDRSVLPSPKPQSGSFSGKGPDAGPGLAAPGA